MIVVGGEAELRVHVRRLGSAPHAAARAAISAPRPGRTIAAIDLVGEGRHQERDVARRHGRADEERNVVLAGRVADMRAVEAARPISRDVEREALVPAEIALVVVVEMDRAVLLGRAASSHAPRRSSRARHRARRQVRPAGHAARAGPRSAAILAGMPIEKSQRRAGRASPAAARAALAREHRLGRDAAAPQRRPFQLAVEVRVAGAPEPSGGSAASDASHNPPAGRPGTSPLRRRRVRDRRPKRTARALAPRAACPSASSTARHRTSAAPASARATLGARARRPASPPRPSPRRSGRCESDDTSPRHRSATRPCTPLARRGRPDRGRDRETRAARSTAIPAARPKLPSQAGWNRPGCSPSSAVGIAISA